MLSFPLSILLALLSTVLLSLSDALEGTSSTETGVFRNAVTKQSDHVSAVRVSHDRDSVDRYGSDALQYAHESQIKGHLVGEDSPGRDRRPQHHDNNAKRSVAAASEPTGKPRLEKRRPAWPSTARLQTLYQSRPDFLRRRPKSFSYHPRYWG